MAEEHDEDEFPDDGWEPSEEEKKAIQKATEIRDRYPTFVIVSKIVQRRNRYKRLERLEVPQQILDREQQLLNEALDQLCDAMPIDPGAETHLPMLIDIIRTFAEELREPHPEGGQDG